MPQRKGRSGTSEKASLKMAKLTNQQRSLISSLSVRAMMRGEMEEKADALAVAARDGVDDCAHVAAYYETRYWAWAQETIAAREALLNPAPTVRRRVMAVRVA